MNDPDDDDWDDDEHDEEEHAIEAEYAIEECGQVHQGGCLLAGTEHCDFECPYRDVDLFEEDE